MQRILGHPVAFVLLYLLFMLPTYILPWIGSNSGVLNTFGAASGAGLHPAFWLHALALAVLVCLAWVRGGVIQRGWLVIFPLLAAVFDLVPVLNWIFLVPTVLHLACIILGVALRAPMAVPAMTR